MSAFRRGTVWCLATWFGCGKSPIGPGTAGSLGAILPELGVLAVAAQDLGGLDDAVSHLVAGGDAPKDVDEHRLHLGVLEDDESGLFPGHRQPRLQDPRGRADHREGVEGGREPGIGLLHLRQQALHLGAKSGGLPVGLPRDKSDQGRRGGDGYRHDPSPLPG